MLCGDFALPLYNKSLSCSFLLFVLPPWMRHFVYVSPRLFHLPGFRNNIIVWWVVFLAFYSGNFLCWLKPFLTFSTFWSTPVAIYISPNFRHLKHINVAEIYFPTGATLCPTCIFLVILWVTNVRIYVLLWFLLFFWMWLYSNPWPPSFLRQVWFTQLWLLSAYNSFPKNV